MHLRPLLQKQWGKIAFTVAFLIILVWALTGPIFDYSETWQLIINTGTTIITYLWKFRLVLNR